MCSLRPHETSLCFSAVFTLNENLDILEEWFGRTVIHSDRRFTYAEAQEIIETGRGDYAEEVLTLNRLAQALRKERFRNGAISFDREEVKFRLDENGKPLGVYFKEQKESNQMIEEFMLLANRRVAEFCGKRRTESGRSAERTMVYRVHDTPSEEKLDRFRQFILRFGHIFKATKGRAVAKELNKLFKQIKGITSAFGTSLRSNSEKNSSGPISAISRAMRSRNISSVSPGFRSTISPTPLPSIRASTASRLIRSATAPSMPRSEKPSSPNSSRTASPSMQSVARTFRSNSPFIFLIQGQDDTSGVSDGRTGSTACPVSAAKT